MLLDEEREKIRQEFGYPEEGLKVAVPYRVVGYTRNLEDCIILMKREVKESMDMPVIKRERIYDQLDFIADLRKEYGFEITTGDAYSEARVAKYLDQLEARCFEEARERQSVENDWIETVKREKTRDRANGQLRNKIRWMIRILDRWLTEMER